MRTRRWILFFLVMILSISLFLPAFAVTSEASKTAKVPTDAVWYNGHAYMIYTQGKSWKQAKKDCEKKGGHLVTITSAKEQVFVRKLVSGTQRQYWIGITDEGHEGDWRWVTGEKGKYRNWGYGNPDNWDNIQHFGVMYSWAKSWGGTSVKPGQWDDDTYKQSYAYICEWDFGGLPAKVKINGGNKVSKGNKIQLTATVSPSSAAQNVRWISSDTSIATVNSSGVVKGKSAGKVIIAALSKADETVMGSISIQVVEKAVKSIKISCETKRINTKETLVLKANVSPSDAVQNIEWSSSDTKVATISSDGKLTAVGKGKVTITAKAIDGSNKKATVKITVQEGLSSKERKQIVDDVKAKYSNSVVSFIDKENTEITNLNEWFTNEQDDLVAKIKWMREEANRLLKFKWPDDPWPWYICAGYPENWKIADWLACKLKKIKSWDDGQKTLLGYKTGTKTRVAGFNEKAKYDLDGYLDNDGNQVSLNDKTALLKLVGKNLIKIDNKSNM